MGGSTLVDATSDEPGHVLSMHGLTTTTGVFRADDKDIIQVIDSDDESDVSDEIDTASVDVPVPPAPPRFSTGGHGTYGSVVPQQQLPLVTAAVQDELPPPSIIDDRAAFSTTMGSLIEHARLDRAGPAKTDFPVRSCPEA
ncbi:hypothetical protein CYMTET_8096 [Cymbomonas tetramitiformis]|uniref:Uncharacterized protein n=1 Tax=Cymbomonas tetramitiformis TaxID=36881 RepID=A0AAE0GUC7_9CHLO|nr:hypothetical protein CYMTET_8096 [Cymbomonas tetramitiformis]